MKLARDLCKTAISEDAYSPLVTSGDIFKAYLSPGLVGVEIHLLIENHLQRLAAEVDKDSMKTLIIQFYAGNDAAHSHIVLILMERMTNKKKRKKVLFD